MLKQPETDQAHFMAMCRLSSLGFNVVSGTLFIPGVPPIAYEFEPKEGVHCKQMQDGIEHHRFIRFADMFGDTSPPSPQALCHAEATPTA